MHGKIFAAGRGCPFSFGIHGSKGGFYCSNIRYLHYVKSLCTGIFVPEGGAVKCIANYGHPLAFVLLVNIIRVDNH
jgi:hypothetical protein